VPNLVNLRPLSLNLENHIVVVEGGVVVLYEDCKTNKDY